MDIARGQIPFKQLGEVDGHPVMVFPLDVRTTCILVRNDDYWNQEDPIAMSCIVTDS